MWHGGDRISTWAYERTGYIAAPDAGLLRFDPDVKAQKGEGPVTPVDCPCALQH